MNHNDDIEGISGTIRWNLCNKKVLCSVDYVTIDIVNSTLLKLLSIEMDNVKREAINLVYELYDETEIFTGVDYRDREDANARERLFDFIARGD